MSKRLNFVIVSLNLGHDRDTAREPILRPNSQNRRRSTTSIRDSTRVLPNPDILFDAVLSIKSYFLTAGKPRTPKCRVANPHGGLSRSGEVKRHTTLIRPQI